MFTDKYSVDFSKGMNVVDLKKKEIAKIDNKIFWHVAIDESIKSYGVYKNNNLAVPSNVIFNAKSVLWKTSMSKRIAIGKVKYTI